MACDIVAGISPFEPQREGVFPARMPDSAGNARPSPRWGGPFGPAQDRLIPALRQGTILNQNPGAATLSAKMRIADDQLVYEEFSGY